MAVKVTNNKEDIGTSIEWFTKVLYKNKTKQKNFK
jgi:hypothetical protein